MGFGKKNFFLYGQPVDFTQQCGLWYLGAVPSIKSCMSRT